MADILVQENKALKMEIDMYHRKVAKLQRVSFTFFIILFVECLLLGEMVSLKKSRITLNFYKDF